MLIKVMGVVICVFTVQFDMGKCIFLCCCIFEWYNSARINNYVEDLFMTVLFTSLALNMHNCQVH